MLGGISLCQRQARRPAMKALRSSDFLAVLALATAALFWAGNMLVGKALNEQVAPLTLAFWRWVLILTILAPFVWRDVVRHRAEIRAALPLLSLLALLGTGLYNALIFGALHFTSATNAALLNSSIPVWTVLLSVLLHRRRPGPMELLGVSVSLCGVAAIISHGSIAGLASFQLNRGDAWMLVAMVMWSLYLLLLPLRPRVLPSFCFLWVTGVLGLFALTLLMLVNGGGETFVIPLSRTSVTGVFYLAVFPSILATLVCNYGIDRIGAVRASQCVHLVPVFASVIAMAWLGETLHWYHAVGFIFVLAGLFIANQRYRDR
ncbi:DMT family transporter [Herbaspirillum sp. 3R11]|nr:DMT family transporter [Herbaspirillum sp. 3R-3a1]TFI10575.1 DMT family transporter [Herbaspirillum sp. 3R11]TFI16482.1 DMT family transporter [Herbaspirillum sp. 3R-11]TFI25988.1 DMT family transporter [Herbaspirillum sp. 3C11]